jgi:hypothetical protein
LESDSYQSDQLGVYGEFYALFGYACLPLLFLVARLLKWTYARVRSGNPFVLATKRVIVLFVFFELLRSFGIDWIIAETVPLIIAVFIYEPFFSARPLTGAQPRLSPASPAAIGPDIASC